MNGWDKSEYIQAPIPSRSQAGWVGWKPGRYRSVLEDRSYSLANKGYSWKDIGDILKAGIQGGTAEGTPIHGMFIQPVKNLKKIPQAVRKLKLGSQKYSTPPPVQKQPKNQVKQAKIKEQNMTYQEVCNALRGEQMKKEASVKKLAGMLKKTALLPGKAVRGFVNQAINMDPKSRLTAANSLSGAQNALERLKTQAPGAGLNQTLPDKMPKWYYQALGQQVQKNAPGNAVGAGYKGFTNFWPNRLAMDTNMWRGVGDRFKKAWSAFTE